MSASVIPVARCSSGERRERMSLGVMASGTAWIENQAALAVR